MNIDNLITYSKEGVKSINDMPNTVIKPEILPDGVYSGRTRGCDKKLFPNGVASYTFNFGIELEKNRFELSEEVFIEKTFWDSNTKEFIKFLNQLQLIERNGFIDLQILDYFYPVMLRLKTNQDGMQDIASIYMGEFYI